MRLEGVVTCVNYDDFLAATLPLNKSLFDQLVVVTTPEDIATQKLCEYWHVKVVTTNAFGKDGEFCKGAGVNEGLKHLKKDGWILHFDADIAFPPLTRHILQQTPLDDTFIYGADRFNLTGRRVWDKHLRRPKLLHENTVYVHAGTYQVATRFMRPQDGGYLPIGFLQFWNPKGSGVFDYPTKHNTAARTDVQFAQRWPREKRGFLPEIIVYHLQSEEALQGMNWSGRKTIRFEKTGIWAWFKRLWHKIRDWFIALWNWLFHRHDPPYSVRSKQKKEWKKVGGLFG